MSRRRLRGSLTRQRAIRSRTLAGRGRRQLRQVGLAREDQTERLGDRLAVEQPRAGEHLVEHDAEGPDVGALVDGLAARLLGRHVGGGAEDHAGRRHGGRGDGRRVHGVARRADRGLGAQRLGEAEVEHLDGAVVADLDVGGLEVAMDDALLVRGLERLGDLAGDGQRLGQRDRAAGHEHGRDRRRRPAPSPARGRRLASSTP